MVAISDIRLNIFSLKNQRLLCSALLGEAKVLNSWRGDISAQN
jgi:hypothetical protein